MLKLGKVLAVAALLAGGVGLVAPGVAQAQKYGKEGEPIHLTVGYQPYYTQAWSGVVMNGLELWKKYLPEGSTVEFQVGLQGAIIVGQLLADKQQIGYMGDMPSIVATTRTEVADVRLVAVLGTSEQQCNIIFVRKDAPEFANAEEAMKWLDDKTVASPHGSCTDRFLRAAFESAGITPSRYYNQNIEVMTTNFQAGKLDGGAIWEPTASKLQLEGIARRVASGVTFGEADAGFLGMRNDLIEARPDIVRAWLEAELDAQLFLADPKNADAVVEMAAKQTTGLSKDVLWNSLYGKAPESGSDQAQVKNRFSFVFSDDVRTLLNKATAFLHGEQKVPQATMRDEALMDSFAIEVLEARGLSSPIGEVRALVAGQ